MPGMHLQGHLTNTRVRHKQQSTLYYVGGSTVFEVETLLKQCGLASVPKMEPNHRAMRSSLIDPLTRGPDIIASLEVPMSMKVAGSSCIKQVRFRKPSNRYKDACRT